MLPRCRILAWRVKTDHVQQCPAWVPPLLAIQFLTRVPVPAVARLSDDAVRGGLGRAAAWFPLVGALVGAVTAVTMLLTDQWWSRVVAVVVALIVEARLTGAFHEDAVADFCDGVGGGRDPEHTRQIMKDSRIGSYGALGLLLAVGLRAVLMVSLIDPIAAAFAIVAAATTGRLIAVIAMFATPAVAGASGLGSAVTTSVRPRDVALAVVTSLPGLLPFAVIAPIELLGALTAIAVFLVWFRRLVVRRVGGITGDCLGFVVYVGQLLVLMAAAT
jgi:adenosylcobinamide-GDP ribazoletransferase